MSPGDTIAGLDFSNTHEGEWEPGMMAIPSWTLTTDGQKWAWRPWAGNEYKWSEGDFESFENAKEYLDRGATEYLTFILQPEDGEYTDQGDPFLMLDFDNVRDPVSGDVIPEVFDFLKRLGPTYIEVSSSGTGLHVMYEGELPEGYETGVTVDGLRDAPVFGLDDEPHIDVYDRRRNVVTTGERVHGASEDAQEPDANALLAICEEHGSEKQKRKNEDPEYDPAEAGDWDPELTRGEVQEIDEADDWDGVFDAIAHVRPRDISLRSTKTEDDGERMSFDPSWEQSRSGTRLGFDDGWIYRASNTGLDALQVVALEERIITSAHEYPSGSKFFDALEALRDRGAHIPEPPVDDIDPTPRSTVDLKGLTELSASERRRAARKRDLDWPSTDKAREMLRDRVLAAMEGEENVIIDAPTALGKSYTVASEGWLAHGDDVTGNQPVVHLHATKDARSEAAEASRDAGVETFELKGREDLCPLAAGYHNPKGDKRTITVDGTVATEFIRKMCNGKGMPYSVVHQFIEENNDQGAEPACCEGETECPTITQWEGVPRDSDTDEPVADVIHATHQFARVPGLTRATNVVFDERPDFASDLTTDDVQRHVTAFLKAVDAPSQTWSQFVRDATFSPENWDDTTADAMREIDQMWEALDSEPDTEWYFEDPDAHTMAPGLAKALWNAFRSDEDANGRRIGKAPFEPPRLDAQASDDEGWNRVWVTVVINEDERIETVRETPGLSLARSVIGLDAHPAEHVWQVNTLPYMEVDELLTHEQRRLWRQFERGLTVVQVGDATRPLTTGEYFDETGLRTFMTHLRDEFGDEFKTAITSSAVEGKMRRVMMDAGINVSRENTMHFGEEKSRNDFGNEEIGVVNGCIDPGDDYVANLLAECGLDAEPATTPEGDREHGRTFEGPDADAANQILASVREQHVAQAAGRYARNADDPDDMATVFVRTDAIPDGFADVRVPGVTWTTTETQREIVDFLQQAGRATAKEIKEAVGCSKRHAAKTLRRLAENGAVRAREKAAENGATLFYDDGASLDGTVDLRITNSSVWDTYTWSFAVAPPKVARAGQGEGEDESSSLSGPIPDAIEDPPDDDQQTLGLVADD